MKVRDAIKYLSQMNQEADFIWHDFSGRNDCEVVSFFYFPRDNRVFVSPCTREQVNKSFMEVENIDLK